MFGLSYLERYNVITHLRCHGSCLWYLWKEQIAEHANS